MDVVGGFALRSRPVCLERGADMNFAQMLAMDVKPIPNTLDPKRGNFKKDIPADCGFTCEVKGD